jgi:hypothetical protein
MQKMKRGTHKRVDDKTSNMKYKQEKKNSNARETKCVRETLTCHFTGNIYSEQCSLTAAFPLKKQFVISAVEDDM